jgi:BirA family biotin operon repressor/biotin-[acetyl-CoA-carboxylase] ligase
MSRARPARGGARRGPAGREVASLDAAGRNNPPEKATRTRLAALLEAAAEGETCSGAELARGLGISRNAVWKHVESLREEGWDVETVHARGYRLRTRPDALDEAAVRAHLRTARLGATLVCKPITGSTNVDAADLGRRGGDDGTVVIADAQTAGRGRLGRSWVSVRGLNLYLSVLLRPAIVPAAAPQLSLVAGIAVAAALEGEGLTAAIKWPNDVLVGGRKICGILTELDAEADRVAFVVVGIGVNLNSTLEHFPSDLHDKATSVYLARGSRTQRARFAARLLEELEARYDRYLEGGFGALAPEWNARSVLTGKPVTVGGAGGAPVTGMCAGIDEDGALVLVDGGVRRRVLAGDATVIGGYATAGGSAANAGGSAANAGGSTANAGGSAANAGGSGAADATKTGPGGSRDGA